MTRALLKGISAERLRELLTYSPETGEFVWRVSRQCVRSGARAGCVQVCPRTGYKHHRIRVDGKLYVSARLAWLWMTGDWPPDDLEVEHADRDSVNNAWTNLRLATLSQNRANTAVRRLSKTGLKGVSKIGKRFKASIRHNKKVHYIGLFVTPEEAHAAYLREAEKRFGEFARTS